MTTIPSRLAQMTRISSSRAEVRLRAIDLYRAWVRAVRALPIELASYPTLTERSFDKAPEICTIYALNVTPAHLRHSIRQKFEQNRHVTDQRAIEVLLLKGQQELQETLNCWKQPDHIYGIMLQNNQRPHRTFLQKFYEGRDEDAVLPAASGVV
ncbi:NdufA6 NADH-ubiquinone oxidoreductase 14.8 kDa subunit [Suillus subaureus]|uniref:NdufA6 NADH-ubiquinone oxidoreductase 14.8 kDa subunit n=1 Tax=Suillus subaureus TaxID=48587 RepID=A0A9P7E020_9AGAM|nr:NdufA6 NADH-ubiquinone oxidoreductase 14.8 kDa subunit [Suillus subaureus]KAG1807159.1 NdufA6 NADH-ubiquinone oxidoreductase 14.8 kDa subunit [Suillus subaureus]